MDEQQPKRRRGFALMDRARVAEMGRLGGRKAHELHLAHTFSHEEAVAAGQKGGKATQEKRRAQQVTQS